MLAGPEDHRLDLSLTAPGFASRARDCARAGDYHPWIEPGFMVHDHLRTFFWDRSGRSWPGARGPYRYIRHPMYLGELVSLCGGLFGNLSAWNVILIAVLLLSLLYRIQREELVIHGYSCYAGQVRWRLIPGVW